MDCSPPGSSVCGISQARILEWVAVPFSRASSQPRSLTLQVDSLPSEPRGKPYLPLVSPKYLPPHDLQPLEAQTAFPLSSHFSSMYCPLFFFLLKFYLFIFNKAQLDREQK